MDTDGSSEKAKAMEYQMRNLSTGHVHLVILGAGASRAACPNGDKNGRPLPLMNDLVEVIGLESTLSKYGYDRNVQDFEALYSEIYEADPDSPLVNEINSVVREYFLALKIPDHPTLYDHLVLSLRSKDMVATFNWDNFLLDAFERNRHVCSLPRMNFLHGNVGIANCDCGSPMYFGGPGQFCKRCGNAMTPSRLLYPVKRKGYAADKHISAAWHDLKIMLERATVLTIFGYRAPKTDEEAMTQIHEGWGDPAERRMEEVEIIDIRNENELKSSWSGIILRSHYRTSPSFYDSTMANFPRRTAESIFSTFMMNRPYYETPIPQDADFPELWEWFKPLVQAENLQQRTPPAD